ncbi:MAG TPA: Holliday junction resolvase RuvX [Aggregatilineales bacterium]|nr:Holliday junction resolvase RuvX [Aggregatilineales bacterium]
MQPLRGRLLGIDHGSKVIGLAVCDAAWIAARPLQILKRRSRDEDFAAIRKIIKEQQIAAVVVGLPELPPGLVATSQADTVRRWIERLAAAIDIPIYTWDEQYSTQRAEELSREMGLRRNSLQDRQARIDDRAAAVILQGFIDAHPSDTSLPELVARKTGRTDEE